MSTYHNNVQGDRELIPLGGLIKEEARCRDMTDEIIDEVTPRDLHFMCRVSFDMNTTKSFGWGKEHNLAKKISESFMFLICYSMGRRDLATHKYDRIVMGILLIPRNMPPDKFLEIVSSYSESAYRVMWDRIRGTEHREDTTYGLLVNSLDPHAGLFTSWDEVRTESMDQRYLRPRFVGHESVDNITDQVYLEAGYNPKSVIGLPKDDLYCPRLELGKNTFMDDLYVPDIPLNKNLSTDTGPLCAVLSGTVEDMLNRIQVFREPDTSSWGDIKQMINDIDRDLPL